MAIDFIKINRTDTAATHAGLLLNYKNTLRQAYELGKEILGVMNHNQDGSDFSPIEALFGLPEGKGQIVYDMLNGSIGAIEGSMQNAQAKNLTETLG